ncbi:MAG: type IV pilus assembly protein PilM [Candidatus Methylacidiphilales bacterium]|nr:type IV pilus assembly protein PilM [Candidatus Methylacidiphilales bacterium]
MAGANRIIALDIGNSTVKLASFAIQNGALTLLAYGSRELGLDPNNQDSRFPAVAGTLQELAKEFRLKGRPVNISVAGNAVFMKFVKLPKVDADQLHQMIGFEAQQNVPFQISEVTWDYQLLRGATADQNEAIIAAIKSDALEEEHRVTTLGGFRPNRVDISSLALYNAYRYNYETTDDCTLLIDIGAKATNFFFIEKDRVYIRPGVPIAGNLLSQNIAADLNEPFASAETLKKGKGFVSLGGAYADPEDPEAARISKVIRNTMTRLHNEINRTIISYRTNQGGTNPRRVLLAGGSSRIPYLDVFLAEKLGVTVAFFNPLRNVNIGPNVDQARLSGDMGSMGELVGLALRETGPCPVEITLEPPSVKAARAKSLKQPFLLIAAAAFAVAMALPTLWNLKQTKLQNERVAVFQDEVTKLNALKARIDKFAPENKNLQEGLAAANKLRSQIIVWPEVMSALHTKIPQGVWIYSLEPMYMVNGKAYAVDAEAIPAEQPAPPPAGQPKGPPKPPVPVKTAAAPLPGHVPITHISVKGLFHADTQTMPLTAGVVHGYVTALADTGLFEIELKDIGKTILNVDTTAANTELALKYELLLKLKQPDPLTP